MSATTGGRLSVQRILSGIQSTGSLTIGNYFGAISNWVSLQHREPHADLFYSVVDLHALTIRPDPLFLRSSTLKVTAALLACGVDPHRAALFRQSKISAHSELHWILACNTPMSWLQRMTQFKDKSRGDKSKANLGLFAYPVLQAADILVYKATHVPVGEDQQQHLELARDIATTVADRYGVVFPLPEMLSTSLPRVMSLRDGTCKMSKSDPSEMSRINLEDDSDTIRHKILKAKTDSLPHLSFDRNTRPEVSNLLQIHSLLSNKSMEHICQEHTSMKVFKEELAELLVQHLHPITTRLHELLLNPDYLVSVLRAGEDRAAAVASRTLEEVKAAVGCLP